ncbi:ABC transporter ATP-binding protein [Candidatus Methanocrinis natronophilus]|uniref:ABC transporter ATP-binding protein n=1 Tax=Candidatus Methanocrinis natronophilus TaxID=3033396 RepID=A0ABT5X9H9_9EURY|nr:ABC transporter ATP-binding protein [Candidatus Methanocrinis natronophilus]MDF0591323.1 ABC transporter ATP-binding protein [Candidatus Methanocrinis natronophilus]
MPALRAEKICKSFKRLFQEKKVLFDISLSIERGEIFGILGPNGAGKTTLMSIFSTLIRPDGGSLEVLGRDALRDTHAIRERINISSGNPNFPWSLTVRENLQHSAMLYGLSGRSLQRSVEEAISAFELGPQSDAKFETLSTGQKQRVSLAKSILNRPEILFLDEPTSGLDPEMAMKTRDLIKKIYQEEEITVVLTTHYMPEAEELCDRIAFLREGRLVALGTPGELKRALQIGHRIFVEYDGEVDPMKLRIIPGVMEVKELSGRVEMVFDHSGRAVSSIIKAFEGADILDIGIEEPDLEDVFLELAR